MAEAHPMLVSARTLGAAVAQHADETNAGRGLAAPMVRAFVDAGFYRMLVPKRLGGDEVSPRVMVEVLEELARHDGSSSWCAMVGATTGLVASLLPEDVARECFPPDAVPCGVFAPTGTAVREEDSYRVRGRWAFGSGSAQATVRLAGVVVRGEGGAPEVRHVLFEPAQVSVVDTWHTAGLRGTGSHDMVADEAVVPVRRTLSLADPHSNEPGALYAFPFFGLLSLGIAGVSLGLGRAALDAFAALATRKAPAGGKRVLAERETAQLHYAEASAAVHSARAWVLSAIDEAEAHARASGVVPMTTRATLRLSAAHAVRACAGAVDKLYNASGGGAVYATSALQRIFQDAHVATQHAMIAEPAWTLAGRVLLGQETEARQL